MQDHPVASYYTTARPRVVQLVTSHGGADKGQGSGFVLGREKKHGRLIVVTARHVLPTSADCSSAHGVRIEWYDEHGKQAKSLVGTPGAPRIGGQGCVECRWHNFEHADIGVLLMPCGEDELPKLSCVESSDWQIADDGAGPAEGTTVAWCGYPAILRHEIKYPLCCYYQGVVSAWIDSDHRKAFVIDGHASQGVSGGPLWWEDQSGQCHVCGIVSSYLSAPIAEQLDPDRPATRTPGLCFAMPVWPVVQYLKKLGLL